MKYSNNYNLFIMQYIENTIRKTAHKCTPDLMVNFRVLTGIFPNLFNNCFKTKNKLFTQS